MSGITVREAALREAAKIAADTSVCGPDYWEHVDGCHEAIECAILARSALAAPSSPPVGGESMEPDGPPTTIAALADEQRRIAAGAALPSGEPVSPGCTVYVASPPSSPPVEAVEPMRAALMALSANGPEEDPCRDEYGADGKRRDEYGRECDYCVYSSDEPDEVASHRADVVRYMAAEIARVALRAASRPPAPAPSLVACCACRKPATCVGNYPKGDGRATYCCDEHCGHRDVSQPCRPITPPPTPSPATPSAVEVAREKFCEAARRWLASARRNPMGVEWSVRDRIDAEDAMDAAYDDLLAAEAKAGKGAP